LAGTPQGPPKDGIEYNVAARSKWCTIYRRQPLRVAPEDNAKVFRLERDDHHYYSALMNQ
jgi:hypothetical protein